MVRWLAVCACVIVGCGKQQGATDQVDGSVATVDAPDTPIVDAAKAGFGEPCNDRDRCESNLCLAGPAGVCTMTCGAADCLDGYGCLGVLGVDVDGVVTEVCVPETDLLCRPCQQDTECEAIGMDKCLTAPDGDRYCSRDCTTVECPTGYACGDVVIANASYRQCVPASTACDCNADNPGATEPCALVSPMATACQGQRTCGGATGWGSCEPASPIDDPDDMFTDTNCDGIDGDVARGIFVSRAGDDAADCGLTPADPCATIGRGIARAVAASREHVYVQQGMYAEAIRMANGVSVFGGYDVAWQRDTYADAAHRVEISYAPSVLTWQIVTIHFSGIISPTTLDNVVVRSGNNGSDSGSSIGVWISGSHLVALRNVFVEPGAGGDGAAGTDRGASSNGGNGGNGSPGCEDASGMCGTCSWPVGGSPGAAASSMFGYPGGAGGRPGHGDPTHGDPDIGGTGHSGDTGGGPQRGAGGAGGGLRGDGTVGAPGADGGNGSHGDGGSGFGIWGYETIYVPAHGDEGGFGVTGGGGGGGGGGGAGDNGCDSYGGSGGGGGGAGDGGSGGRGGRGGGPSFGVLAQSSSFSVQGSIVKGGPGGRGGRGGVGGNGGIGGDGGLGGVGLDDAGNGGRGGRGGNGGRGGDGGGGGGGPSIGIVCLQTANTSVSVTVTDSQLLGGVGGAGGTSGGNPGATGISVGSRDCM